MVISLSAEGLTTGEIQAHLADVYGAEGGVVQGWKPALGALALAYPERLAAYLT